MNKKIRYNSVNLTSCNLEILIIQLSKRAVSRPDTLLFTIKKASSMKTGKSQKHVPKGLKSVCTSTVSVPPDLSSPDPSTSLAMKTRENTGDDPEDPEPADGGDIQMEYSSD